jgi:hypothetical protein
MTRTNGHQAAREKLALEVQAEALRPTPPLNGYSLQDRLSAAWRRIRELEELVSLLQRQKRENKEQFRREVATQRRELGIN